MVEVGAAFVCADLDRMREPREDHGISFDSQRTGNSGSWGANAEAIEVLSSGAPPGATLRIGGGHSMIFGPDGRPLCDPLPEDQERLLIAEVDIGSIAIARASTDPIGHYSCADVTKLLIDHTLRRPVEEIRRKMSTGDGG